MKKIALTLCFILLFGALCIPTCAQEEYELLENGDFEEFSTTWEKYYLATVDYCDTAHTGNSAFQITNRKHSTDIARQYITKPLTHYGPGTYELSAWIRLADPQAEPIPVQIAIGVYLTNGQKQWFTTGGWVTVTSEWTHISGVTNISWSGEIETAEFYLVSPMDGQEDQSKNFRDLYLDDCSMKALSYTGEPYAPPTQAPVTTEPETETETETETSAPESEAQTTTAPETAVPETEIEPESTSEPTDGQEKGQISAQTWVIAGTMAAVALILLCCGIARTVSYARGKRHEASK